MSDFVEVKAQELSGVALDWATAKATGAAQLKVTESGAVCCIYAMACGSGCWTAYYEPSTDWAYGGSLIEKYAVTLTPLAISFGGAPSYWLAQPWDQRVMPLDGPTPLIAAYRALVASVLGDTVSVPKELLS